jgi:hypothetical protein
MDQLRNEQSSEALEEKVIEVTGMVEDYKESEKILRTQLLESNKLIEQLRAHNQSLRQNTVHDSKNKL